MKQVNWEGEQTKTKSNREKSKVKRKRSKKKKDSKKNYDEENALPTKMQQPSSITIEKSIPKRRDNQNFDAQSTSSRPSERKLLLSIMKLAKQLKVLQDENAQHAKYISFYSDIWFGLLLDGLTVSAFLRVGYQMVPSSTRADEAQLTWPIAANFAIFWIIWMKEYYYLTRFDSSDLLSRLVTLLTCLAVLYGMISLSTSSSSDYDSLNDDYSTGLMVSAASVALLHFLLHARIVSRSCIGTTSEMNEDLEQTAFRIKTNKYAVLYMVMNAFEALTWIIGIVFISGYSSSKRLMIYVIGIMLCFRTPHTHIGNDFHAASHKRGILIILLLVFLLQNIILVAYPLLDSESPPSSKQFQYFGLICLFLFSIKYLHKKNDSVSVLDHAINTHSMSGFIFECCQYTLLLSITILGIGLSLLSQSFLSSTITLSITSRRMTMEGFAAMVASMFIIHILHIRRLPVITVEKVLFCIIYVVLQPLCYLSIIFITVYWSSSSFFMTLNEMQIIGLLCAFIISIIFVSWLDGFLELFLYGNKKNADDYRVITFGLFWNCMSTENRPLLRSGVLTTNSNESVSLLSDDDPYIYSSI